MVQTNSAAYENAKSLNILNMERESKIEKPPNPRVLLSEDGKEVGYGYQEVIDRLGVDGLIRIPETEFDDLMNTRNEVAHFNLGTTNHEKGKRYAFVKILRNGTYATETTDEMPPLLSLDGAIIMECVEVENALSPASLTSDRFEYSYAGIADEATLKAALIRRYGQTSSTGLTEADIEARGMAYTLLRRVK